MSDPTYSGPSDKSEWGLRKGTPKITRKVGNRLQVDYLEERPTNTSFEDEIMDGVPDYGGAATGFAAYVATQPPLPYEVNAAAGAGDPVRPRRRNDSYDSGPSQGLDQNWQFTEDPGEEDLMGGPNPGPDRREYGDFVENDEYEAHVRGAENSYDQNDLWDMDVADDFFEDRHEGEVDKPTFTGKPHRQREAASNDKLAASLLDILGEIE